MDAELQHPDLVVTNTRLTPSSYPSHWLGMLEAIIVSFASGLWSATIAGFAIYAMSEVGGSIAYRFKDPAASEATLHEECITPAAAD